MRNMTAALDDAGIAEPARSALQEVFENSSAYVVNSGEGASVLECRAEPAGRGIHQAIRRQWDSQRVLDEAVAAVRGGEPERVRALVESLPLRTRFERNRSVFANFVAQLIGSGQNAMLDYVQVVLPENRDLAHERFSGRTLLHAASAAGNLTCVELLLRLGADPSAKDGGGHTPLYSLGNESMSGGGGVAKALIQAGANVDACDGVKRCTPLHMAARRGNVEVCQGLLDCGADIEACDSAGDTPLRRAVNCKKMGVAVVLLERGADVHSRGSKNLTPLSAARAGEMSRLLQSWVADSKAEHR